MISMPNNIYICADCMQRTFDSINNSGINYDDMMKMYNMPGFGNMNFNDVNMDIPNKQKIKKKKKIDILSFLQPLPKFINYFAIK